MLSARIRRGRRVNPSYPPTTLTAATIHTRLFVTSVSLVAALETVGVFVLTAVCNRDGRSRV